ncbi:hypothetical protein AM593_02083, partial [Mytilus galloprovincialis]
MDINSKTQSERGRVLIQNITNHSNVAEKMKDKKTKMIIKYRAMSYMCEYYKASALRIIHIVGLECIHELLGHSCIYSNSRKADVRDAATTTTEQYMGGAELADANEDQQPLIPMNQNP